MGIHSVAKKLYQNSRTCHRTARYILCVGSPETVDRRRLPKRFSAPRKGIYSRITLLPTTHYIMDLEHQFREWTTVSQKRTVVHEGYTTVMNLPSNGRLVIYKANGGPHVHKVVQDHLDDETLAKTKDGLDQLCDTLRDTLNDSRKSVFNVTGSSKNAWERDWNTQLSMRPMTTSDMETLSLDTHFADENEWKECYNNEYRVYSDSSRNANLNQTASVPSQGNQAWRF